MTGKDIFRIWAPIQAKWVDWVRPVPFVNIDNDTKIENLGDFTIPKIFYLDNNITNTAIIVDLPRNDSIKEGLGLINYGFRPIPIYNGTIEQENSISTVNNNIIELGLIKGSIILKNAILPNDAPPAFLLDSTRTNRYKMDASVFDNSWDIYHQDLPSAEFFLNNNINKIIIRGTNIVSKDLNKILYKFQKKGIKILFTDGFEKPKIIHLKKPYEKEDF